MERAAASQAVPGQLTTARRKARSHFYVGASALLLAIAFIGFAKSFYLKIFFGTPPLPAHVHLHGAVMTGWFVLLLIQTLLVQSGRTDLHRRLGIAAAVLAASVVSSTICAAILAIPRLEAAGLDPIFFTLSGFGGAVFFGAWVAAALWWKRRPDVHRPLMLFATLQLVTAAIARIPLLVDDSLTRILVVQGLFLLALAARDVIGRGRPRGVTLLGGSALLLSSPFLTWVSITPVAPALVRWLT